MEDEMELEMSPHCQTVEQDGTSVRVEIYRSADSGWILEVVDETGTSTIWDEPFTTDDAALAEFRQQLESAGIRSFLEPVK